MGNVTDFQKARKKNKRKKLLRRIVFLVVFAGMLLLAVLFREEIGSLFGVLDMSGSLTREAQGYPQQVSGTQVKKVVATASGDLAVLSDMTLSVYSSDAKRVTQIQHSYDTPDVVLAGDYILIFNRGGNHYSLYTRTKLVYTRALDSPISQATLAQNGSVAVVSASEKTNTRLQVFSKQNKELLKWSSTKQITGLAFRKGSSQLAVAAVYTDKGLPATELCQFDLHKETPVFDKTISGQMVLALHENAAGRLLALSDEKLMRISAAGEVDKEYGFAEKRLLGFQMGEKTTALVFQGAQDLDSSELVMLGEELDAGGQVHTSEKVHDLHICDDKIIAVTDRQIYVYGPRGDALTQIVSNGLYASAVYVGGHYIGISNTEIVLLQ